MKHTESCKTSSLQTFLADLRRACPGGVGVDVSLAAHSYWDIGGPADFLVEPGSTTELQYVLALATKAAIPFAVIGGGTNILFPDEGFRGLIIKVASRLSRVCISGCHVSAEAGVWVPRLAHAAGNAGLAGLQHIVGIPGYLGGLVLMNGGSQRKGIGSHVIRVEAFDRQGNYEVLDRDRCGFAYRTSTLQKSGHVIASVELQLEAGEVSVIRREMLAIMQSRRLKFPKQYPNCGSVFISRPDMYDAFGAPGKIIEDTGLKGTRIGGALIPALHANFIVNAGGATAEDIKAVVRLVREKVHERTGFWMICEVRTLLSDGTIVPLHEAI